MYNWDRENCPLYRVAECPLFRGCLSIEVNGRAIGTFRIVHYIVGVRYSGESGGVALYIESVLNIQLFVTSVCLLCMFMSSLTGVYSIHSSSADLSRLLLSKSLLSNNLLMNGRWYFKIHGYAEREMSQPQKKEAAKTAS